MFDREKLIETFEPMKEKEPVAVKRQYVHRNKQYDIYKCTECGEYIAYYRRYCCGCRRAVKWNDW